MASTVVFDLDKGLIAGDASTLVPHGRLRQAPAGALPAPARRPAAASPVYCSPRVWLLVGTAHDPGSRWAAARALTSTQSPWPYPGEALSR